MHDFKWLAATALSTFLLLGSSAALAQDKLKDSLVGKWKKTEKVGDKELTIVLQLTKDNKVNVTIRDFKKDGTFKVLGEKSIEITLGKKSRLEVEVKGNQLTTTDKNGRKDTFTRVDE